MEKNNFISFLEKRNQVIIPKIQREYVQGQNERGQKFVQKIFQHLRQNNVNEMSMDLVFGTEETKEKKVVFCPVDGQQRLTTLFLLYWYVGKLELKDNELKDLKKELSKFSYDTRDTSREFLKDLCGQGYTEKLKLTQDEVPSEVIANSAWYFEKYQSDYTIKSMLSMLDMIQEEYVKCQGALIYGRLKKLVFYEIVMNDYSLGDELYVIMNDRGKSLTPYENFKSSLLGWIQKESMEKSLELAEKLDTSWGESVWENCQRDDEKADTVLYQFFIRYLWIKYVIALEDTKEDAIAKKLYECTKNNLVNDKGTLKKEAKQELDFDTYLKPVLDKITEQKSKQTFCDELKGFLDHYFLSDKWKDFLTSPFDGKTEGDLFALNGYTLSSRGACFGYMLYVLKHPDGGTEASFREWKRFVWNILEASNAEDALENAERAMRIINAYADHTDDIVKGLAAKDEAAAKAEAERLEIRKAKYLKMIENSSEGKDEWRTLFDQAEKHAFLRGYLDFEISKAIELKKDDKEAFENRLKRVSWIFPGKRADGTIVKGFEDSLETTGDYLVLRALLSKQCFMDEKEKSFNFGLLNQDTERGVLRTQIIRQWSQYLADYVFNDGLGTKKDLIECMKKDCHDCRKRYENADPKTKPRDNFIYWQNELSNNADLMQWIQQIASDREQNVGIVDLRLAGTKIYFGQYNSNGVQIWLDEESSKFVNIIKSKGYSLMQPDKKNTTLEKNFTNGGGDPFTLYLGRSMLYFMKGKEYLQLHSDGAIRDRNKLLFQRSKGESVDAYVSRIVNSGKIS